MFLKSSYVLIFSLIISISCSSELEKVNDDDLLNLLMSENYVVVLFTKKDSPESEKFENEIINIREDLVDNLNCWVVKAVDSQLKRLYSTSEEPILVFFRHGIPLLYDGPLDDEQIIFTLTDNREPAVKELSDSTFEHLTQASSGATTGDWFVMFTSTNCVECKRLQAVWEAVGAKLKTRMNVAVVNRETSGRVTARRFGIVQTPVFVLFRLGNMYQYNIPNYTPPAFVSFATTGFRHARAVKVPLPKTPFDDLITAVADYLIENPWMWKVFSACGTFITVLIVFLRIKATKENIKQKKSAKSSQNVKKVK